VVSINFGLVIWQLITFVLLLWLLGKVAWKPILRALEERERTIKDSLGEARGAREEALRVLEEHQQKLQSAQAETAEILAAGRREAEALRASLMEKSRAEADELLARARGTIEGEKKAALIELRTTAAELAVAAAGKLLEANLSDAKQRELAERAIAELTADQLRG